MRKLHFYRSSFGYSRNLLWKRDYRQKQTLAFVSCERSLKQQQGWVRGCEAGLGFGLQRRLLSNEMSGSEDVASMEPNGGRNLNVLAAQGVSNSDASVLPTERELGDTSRAEKLSSCMLLPQTLIQEETCTPKPLLAMQNDQASNPLAPKGVLVPLKTTLETRASDRTVEVYVTAVPVKLAHGTLNLIRDLVPDDGGINLQHLRRFVKYADVPESVRTAFHAANSQSPSSPLASDPKTPEPEPLIASESESASTSNSEASKELLLIIGSINAVSHTTLFEALSASVSNVTLFTIPVPLLAPTSQEQAKRLSGQYWPTVYKKSNPFGPHPSIVTNAEEEIRDDVPRWMGLAEDIARESKEQGVGEGVGVVIVERRNGVARAVAVAGDARWRDWGRGGCGSGNVTAHAAMRGIAMVAECLRAEGEADEIEKISTLSEMNGAISKPVTPSNIHQKTEKVDTDPARPSEEEETSNKVSTSTSIFNDTPLLPIEVNNLYPSPIGSGYLCHELEIYTTHEPCVMCSMAIVHSRFGRVVFARRMHETGGLCADGDLGHGLFWRKELNWTMLAWHWDTGMREERGKDMHV